MKQLLELIKAEMDSFFVGMAAGTVVFLLFCAFTEAVLTPLTFAMNIFANMIGATIGLVLATKYPRKL